MDAPLSIAYLGPLGTFSELAATVAGGPETSYLPLASMPAVVTAVETRAALAGVLPIENSLEGGVSNTLDVLIHETNLHICREIVIPIRHMLACRPGLTLGEIELLYSHQQPLAQSRRFVQRCLPNVPTVASLSTAAALQDALTNTRAAAALTTLHAAERAGATILARDVQDNSNNVTRFVVLGHEPAAATGDDKTSLMFTVHVNRVGALVEALNVFAQAGINLTKIESRPTKAELGEYVFLVDVEGHRSDANLATALQELRHIAAIVKVFGSYPRFRG
ncbi:MAG: prephenate dehydratase [Herpetosiphonaceae bacterium]|nr:prephenate dehydratase [Herpetosiphonaceae bacterium]